MQSSNGSSRAPKRKKLRLMCLDLTGDLETTREEQNQNKYELSDIKDSCTIDYNGETIEFNVKQLNSIRRLGEGCFGFVSLCQLEHRPDVIFACKRIPLENRGDNNYSSESDLKAIRAVGNERHPHIVVFYASLIDLVDGQLVICMEALETNMEKFYSMLHSRFLPSPSLLDLFIRRLAKHIVLALDYLKSKNIIHRDVKPQNILIVRPATFKLCDFGICGTLKDSIARTHRGSLRYLPPERLGNVRTYGTQSDMWALGMSLLEISQGFLPLASESIMSFMSHIIDGWQPDLPQTLSPDCRDLLLSLLSHNVDERPRRYSDILATPVMISVQEFASSEEVILINNILDALATVSME